MTSEFCKAITYFLTDSNIHEHPFYHRDESCGTKTLDTTQKFTIFSTNTNLKAQNIKKVVKTCYLERLIFDAIYSKIFRTQDTRHLLELRKMELLFQNYYPGEKLRVHIEYYSGMYPNELTVYHTLQDDKVITYTYKKAKYDDTFVQCTRNKGNFVYEKTQSFEKQSEWQRRTRSATA